MLTSQITTLAPTSEPKPSKWIPPTISSVIQSISTLMKNSAMPTVSRISGSARSLTTGLTSALTTPKTAAAMSSDVQPASVASPTKATAA